MCGISGGKGNFLSEYAARSFNGLSHRGRDGSTLLIDNKLCSNVKDGNEYLLHFLHSVVGNVKQPIQRDGSLVINCEIYNWEVLAQKYSLKVSNDAELVCALLDIKGIEGIEELDGVYAGVYLKDGVYTLFRDVLGVKPLYYDLTDGFFFASEPNVLKNPVEVHPRLIYVYDQVMLKKERSFFDTSPVLEDNVQLIKSNVYNLFLSAVKKRIPTKKIAVLFSGGVDSTAIALLLDKLGVPFTCVTVACTNGSNSSDLEASINVCSHYGWDLEVVELDDDTVKEYAVTVSNMINDCNVVKTEVGVTLYAACLQARKLGAKVVFSGLGSEEIFAGYDRHKKSADISRECLSGLRKMYERDLVRDDIVSMQAGVEVRLPFLDHELVSYALRIPVKYKMHTLGKDIFRESMYDNGLIKLVAFRPKKAAQYGSRVSDALRRVTKGYKKSEWLFKHFNGRMPRLSILLSGGKDSLYSAYIMSQQKYLIHSALTIMTENQFSYMFQHHGIELTSLQCESMGIPHVKVNTMGEKEVELKDLKEGLLKVQLMGAEGVIVGALSSTYQRDRVEMLCDQVGLKVFAPCWNKGQHDQMNELFRADFKFIMTLVAADGLDSSWLARIITNKDYRELSKLEKVNGLHVAGEGGEFETLVLDCPLFNKKISLTNSKIHSIDKHTHYLEILDADLNDKT